MGTKMRKIVFRQISVKITFIRKQIVLIIRIDKNWEYDSKVSGKGSLSYCNLWWDCEVVDV